MTGPATEVDEVLAPSARAMPRWRVGLGAAIVLFVIGVGVAVVSGLLSPSGGLRALPDPRPTGGAAITSAPATAVPSTMVHMLGQVSRPGVYELPAGARVIDAVGAAGGFSDSADRGALNLARQVADGEQVYVPKPGETLPAAAGAPGAAGRAAATAGTTGSAASGTVDVNSATLEQLETLPRVGPSLGQRILDWRAQNGRFASVDDLKNVAGIGDKTFADLQGLVTAG